MRAGSTHRGRELLVLDAAPERLSEAMSARRAIGEHAAGLGWTVTSFHLPDLQIADCVGDFKCWTRTPGICGFDDANREISRAFVQSDVAVFLTPVTFGGYSFHLKKALDHFVVNILPLFKAYAGETRHAQRYDRLPDVVAVGLTAGPDEEAERVFAALVGRNVLNTRSARHAVAFVRPSGGGDPDGASIVRALDHVLAEDGRQGGAVFGGSPAGAAIGPSTGETPEPPPGSVRRALLLTGSPAAASSTSASLGEYLFGRLAAQGIETETLHIYRAQEAGDDLSALAGVGCARRPRGAGVAALRRLAAGAGHPDARTDSRRLGVRRVGGAAPVCRHREQRLSRGSAQLRRG